MNLEFSTFLLGYTERFFLKKTDIASLSISITALIVSTVSLLIVGNSIGTQQNGIVIIIDEVVFVGLSVFIFYIVYNLIYKLKKNNDLIFKIEKIIIQNYDDINAKSREEKDCILEEFKQVYTKKKDAERLLKLLSKSARD